MTKYHIVHTDRYVTSIQIGSTVTVQYSDLPFDALSFTYEEACILRSLMCDRLNLSRAFVEVITEYV